MGILVSRASGVLFVPFLRLLAWLMLLAANNGNMTTTGVSFAHAFRVGASLPRRNLSRNNGRHRDGTLGSASSAMEATRAAVASAFQQAGDLVGEERRRESSTEVAALSTYGEPPQPQPTSSSSPSSFPSSPNMVAQRAAEVASVAVLDLALPLIASAARFAAGGGSGGAPGQRPRGGWDAFWSTTSCSDDGDGHRSSAPVSNADRVASAMEQLGPTYVKFGQALSSRPDVVPPSLAASLSKLQDRMEPFDTDTARDIISSELLGKNETGGDNDGFCGSWVSEESIRRLIDSLPSEPVAAASVGQVYKGSLPEFGAVAVKVQRPGVRQMVEMDAALLRRVAALIESIPALPSLSGSSTSVTTSSDPRQQGRRLVATELVSAIDEFMGRLFEELDYDREANNIVAFGDLYSIRRGTAVGTMPERNGERGVVVPELLPELCTENVLVMEWIEGTKLTDVSSMGDTSSSSSLEVDPRIVKENLALIELATQCTLSQLLDTGVLHADPHGGNLLKVRIDDADEQLLEDVTPARKRRRKRRRKLRRSGDDDGGPRYRLAYLDFGIVSSVPSQVRDALVCAVAQLIFAKDVDAVADLFGELQLLPMDVLSDPVERSSLQVAMKRTMDESLRYPDGRGLDDDIEGVDDETSVPVLLFDKLLDSLARLVPRFRFNLPPYFINNARALSTLEGIARSLDPKFNVLQVMYPYALNRMLQNPTASPVVEGTLQGLIRSEATGRVDKQKVKKLLRDSALITGYRQRRILWDVVKTRGGRRVIFGIAGEEFNHRVLQRLGKRRFSGLKQLHRKRRARRRMSDFFRL